MKKKFLIFMTVLLVAMLVLSVVACSDYTDPDDDKTTEDTVSRTQLVTNGTFYNATSSNKKDYVKNTVTGWSATKGSLATSANGVAMGAIDLANTESFDLNKDKFYLDGAITNPGVDPATPKDIDDEGNPIEDLQDTNALVVASKTTSGSVYYKNSSSFNLEAGKYYLLQYSVATFIDMTDVEEADKAKKGAWIHVTGGVEHVDSCINTNGEWVTKYLYIETNKDNKTSLDIRLWLGNGPEKINGNVNAYTTKGVAFFDNIICKEITSIDDTVLNHDNFASIAATKGNYESNYYLTDAKLEQTTETTPTSTNAVNYFYSFREGSYSSINVKNYSAVKGKSGISSSEQPSVTNAFTGIVDLAKLYATDATADSKSTYNSILKDDLSKKFFAPSYTDWKDKIMTSDVSALDETKALMIYHSDLSGLGFTSKTTLKIESNKYYKISVNAYVWAPVDGEGNFVWPTDSKPTEPKAYTEAEQVIVGYNDGTTAFPATVAFADYVKALSDTEEETAGATVTDNTTVNTYVMGDEVKNAMITAGYSDKVLANFRWLYVYENFDALVTAGALADTDETYVTNKYLNERNTFINGTWKDLSKLIDSWDTYNNDYASYMAKYLVWQDSNGEGPYAKVKLSGAGSDLEQKTTTYNAGWETLEFYVKGNQLSARNLTLEFWFGEGTATEYENLMFGGVFFDNISVVEAVEGDSEHWDILSPLNDEAELSFGGLINDEVTTDYWTSELANPDTMASGDVDNISLTTEGADIDAIEVGGATVTLKQLVYTHTAPTASVLTSVAGANHANDIKIAPNKAYRFALRVKTTGIEEGKGVKISLMGGTDDEDKAEVSSITSFNSEEWKEVVFYVMGDAMETNYVGLKITMGEGTRFDTSKYVQGSVSLAVANCTEIEYSEYNASTKSGDETKTYSFANTTTASDSVTNGSFSSINYEDTEDKAFDADGKLVGVATTASWTKGSAVSNSYNAPELTSTDNGSGNYTLKWAPVVGIDAEGNDTKPTQYEVYARFVEGSGTEAKTVERLYKVVDANDSAEYTLDVDMAGYRSTAFRVRGVSDTAVGTYSSYKVLGTTAVGNVIVTENDEVAGKKEYAAGTIVNDGSLFAGSSYKSPYDTVLKITSNYSTALSMTSSSKSLNANTYYNVTVWVKTVDGAKASVTVNDLSNVLSADVDENYVGYAGIDTEGKWIQYGFYIKTGSSSSSFKLELSLGNPYASKTSKKPTGASSNVSVYNVADLSSGEVYFDSVRVFEVDENEYEDELAKGEYEDDGTTVKLHTFEYLYDASNAYAVRNLEYTVDSFDSFEENKTEEGKDGYNLGHTPNSYTWKKANDATGTDEKSRLYGVYNYNMEEDKLNALFTNVVDNESKNVFEEFMPENFDIKSFLTMQGHNSLVMSNKAPYAQSYTTSSTSTINSKGYYKLTFNAKALLAREEKDKDDKVTIKTDNVNAEFRFMQNSATDKYQSILINGVEEKEYTLYIYNPSSTSSSAKWAFVLGDNVDKEDVNGVKQLVLGMMVIDQVALTTITEADYTAAKATYDALDSDGKRAASTKVYSYDEDKKTEEPEEDPEENPEEEKPSIWDRGEVWLLVSSLVLAVLIIIVVVVVLIRQWKKKHPKEVVGENVVKADKNVPVVESRPNDKVDLEDDDEYSDVVKPVYNQRVVNKGKNNKKKKKK